MIIAKISGKDIIDRLDRLDEKLTRFAEANTADHDKIKNVSKKGLLIATGAIGLTIMLMGFLITHISR